MALIGSYAPRRCGIATFTADLAGALGEALGPDRVQVVAVNDRVRGYDYPREVQFEIQENRLADYRMAADSLNANRVGAVLLQHEFGIFGGRDGAHVLKLLRRLRLPVVTTLHTVLQRPSPSQAQVVRELGELSDRLVVMTRTAEEFLRRHYEVDPGRVRRIPHGIPDLPFIDPNYYKDQFGVEGRSVLLTFGLLSPGKGIETVLRALPRIVAVHPDVVYIVLGATHPAVRRERGEDYRIGLAHLARELGVEEHVVFHDRFVELGELCEFLGAADVYLTPYLNREQITSGTLVYAMGAGKAVVSTPYWHAAEALADGRGRLVGFGDHQELARAVIELLSDEVERHATRKRAYEATRDAVWSAVGQRYAELVDEVRAERAAQPRVLPAAPPADHSVSVPEIDLRHVRRLADECGLLQHATYSIPNREHGYCTDDNARALATMIAARPHLTDAREADELAARALAFLLHAFNPQTGTFRNFLSYDRRWLEEGGSPDCQGRAVGALGLAAASMVPDSLRPLAASLLRRALPAVERAPDLRAAAFAVLGLDRALEAWQGDTAVRRTLRHLAERLFSAYRAAGTDPSWLWPEERLTYANAAIPHALLVAGRRLGESDMRETALASLRWLVELQSERGVLSPIGNDGWFQRGGPRARFDQQPIEAEAIVAACAEAFEVTGDRGWLDGVLLGFEWFQGRNDLRVPLHDPATGGCRDGLHPLGASENQGAESTLAWLAAVVRVHALQSEGELGWTRGDHVLRPQRAPEAPVLPGGGSGR